MKLRVDKESDALYLRLDESAIVESEEVHEVVWDGSDVQSGIYLIQVSSSGFSEVRKVVLVR